MNSRILTFGALSGMLVAAGCGGGSGAGAGSPTLSSIPAIGGSAPAGRAKGSFAASFLIPYSEGRASAASSRSAEGSRSPKYLSPGTTGLQIFIGNGTVNSTSVPAQTAQLGVAIGPSSGAGLFTSPTQVQLSPGTISSSPVVGEQLTIAGIDATAVAGIPAVFTITGVTGGGTILTGTWNAALYAGTAAATTIGTTTQVSLLGVSGLGQTAVIGTASAPLALAPGTTTKAIPSTVNGATASSTVTYSFGPSTTAGYYTFSAVFSNFTPSITETVGVVTTDMSNNNYVLSEAQGTVSIPASGIGEPSSAFVLSPVVANIFVPTPTLVTLASEATTGASYTAGAGTLALGSLETTVFATDEMGYVIPSTSGTSENLTNFVITAATAGNLTFQTWSQGTSPAVSNTSLTALPIGAAGVIIGINTATITSPGAFLTNILTPSAPFSLSTNGAIPNGVTYGGLGIATNSAGTPLAIKCAANPSSSVAWNAVLTSTNPSIVTGYTYTYGTNYPALTKTIPLTPINCSSGFVVPIN